MAAIGTGRLRPRARRRRASARSQDAADFVLERFLGRRAPTLPILVVDAADAVEQIAAEGLTPAQKRFHAR